MKKSRNEQTNQNKQGYYRKPEIRDDLDSRKNKEYRTKEEVQKAKKKESKKDSG